MFRTSADRSSSRPWRTRCSAARRAAAAAAGQPGANARSRFGLADAGEANSKCKTRESKSDLEANNVCARAGSIPSPKSWESILFGYFGHFTGNPFFSFQKLIP